MDKQLLDVLRCPRSQLPLRMMATSELASLNHAVADGSLADRDGIRIERALAAALITTDGAMAYPIEDGIPVLLEGKAIVLK